jgi:hypothetical protein
MTERIYTFLFNFNTIQEGVDYMSNSPHKVAFSVGGQTYDKLGNPIPTPDYSDITEVVNVFSVNNTNPWPGELYVDNGFLRYYKEIGNE